MVHMLHVGVQKGFQGGLMDGWRNERTATGTHRISFTHIVGTGSDFADFRRGGLLPPFSASTLLLPTLHIPREVSSDLN